MVSKIPAMVDLAMDAEEKQESMNPSANPPKYPWGLSISLCEKELDKLGLLEEDMCVGDMLHIHALAKVTSVSSNETENGSNRRVELQICYMASESEDEENSEEDKSVPKLYRK